MIKFVTFTSLLLCAAAFGAGHAQAKSNVDEQIWLSTTATADLGGDFKTMVFVGGRLSDAADGLSQIIIVPPALGYKVSDTTTLWGGFAYGYMPGQGTPDVHEYRFWQQASFNVAKAGRLRVKSYVRLDQRNRNDKPGVGFRLRTNWTLERKLGTSPSSASARLTVEPMVYLNSTAWGAKPGIDRVRTIAGFSLPITKYASLEPAYVNEVINVPGGKNRMLHAGMLNATMRY